MLFTVLVDGQEFKLGWNEFEFALSCVTAGHPLVATDVTEGGAYATA